jgi:hypothetical protein
MFGFGKEKEEPQESALPTSYDRQCAWCLEEAGQAMGNGSHGMCKYHRSQMDQARFHRQLNKFQAVPAYVEQQAAAFVQEASATLSAHGYVFCAECDGYYLPHEH